MLAQVIAICIFLGMFLLIILDQFERHIITLVSGALVLILVFGVCMHSPATIWEALNLRSFFTADFWYGAGEESTAGINWSTILFIAGMLLDAISIYYVLLPFLMPIMAHFGWDPVWFGVMMTINLALGQVTPPVAVNLYVGAKISNLTMEEITPPVLPMLLASMLALVVIVLFPDITLFLPRLLGM